MPFAKVSQDFFYKVSYKIFHQPFLHFIKFSVLSLILGTFNLTGDINYIIPDLLIRRGSLLLLSLF
ncbi:MAG TPA: hypothetical protein HPP56_10445 [Nitrospirae bacterium]|nr:hypothetical protein [Nitrospirota bacterium]